MARSIVSAAAVAALSAAPALAGVGAARFPPNHPPTTASTIGGRNFDLLVDFAGELGCPYASEWLTKGPERAARDLADSRRRRLRRDALGRAMQAKTSVAGSCDYTSAYTGRASCVEFRGDKWTTESMTARCGEPGTAGTLTEGGAGCAEPESLAGWCVVVTKDDGAAEASPLDASAGSCSMMKTACETWMTGTFAAAEACGGDFDEEGDAADAASAGSGSGQSGGGFFGGGGGEEGEEGVQCAIAPGPIGAAHQAGYSGGYLADCPGTPAEGSPYMWPLKWSAESESRYMAFGSDEVVYRSRGRVYYMLDKNWKRQDTHFQEGVLRTIGQMPCDEKDQVGEEEGVPSACDRNRDRLSTMLHRGGKMFFIYWKDGTAADDMNNVTNIEECSWIDMQIVGNIRPDWYMDDRGDDTDVQYLGNQHVFHADMEARLVKQWRKKDFANQYFTMSMSGNPKPDENGIHWPLVLNIPGEGFGDDALRMYKGHAELSEDDQDLFLLDQLLEADGGTCAQRVMDGEGTGGPPVLEEPIPSNLEIDPNSWFSNVYTYSPVWDPPAKGQAAASTPSREGGDGVGVSVGVAITEAGPSTTVASCYDADAGEARLTVSFGDVAAGEDGSVPWLGLAFRDSEECLMTPRDGSDGEFVYVHQPSGAGGELEVLHGPLPAGAKRLAGGAGSVLDGLTAVGDAGGLLAGGDARLSEDGASVELSLRRVVSGGVGSGGSTQVSRSGGLDGVPKAMHLTYAVGSSAELGYHKTRKCFDVVEFPPCKGAVEKESSDLREEKMDGEKVETAGSTSNIGVAAKSAGAGTNEGVILASAISGIAFFTIFGGVW